MSVALIAAMQISLALPMTSGAQAAAPSILKGDAQLEAWLSEIQAEILLDVHLDRAETLGDRALSRTTELWGPEDESNAYQHNYATLHLLLAVINNRRTNENVDRKSLMNAVTSAMTSKATLTGAEKISQEDENIIDALINITRARIECRFGNSGRTKRAYQAAVDSLQKANLETVDRSVALMEAYVNDGGKYDGLSSYDEQTMVLADDIGRLTMEQIREIGVVARVESEQEFCRTVYTGVQ